MNGVVNPFASFTKITKTVSRHEIIPDGTTCEISAQIYSAHLHVVEFQLQVVREVSLSFLNLRFWDARRRRYLSIVINFYFRNWCRSRKILFDFFSFKSASKAIPVALDEDFSEILYTFVSAHGELAMECRGNYFFFRKTRYSRSLRVREVTSLFLSSLTRFLPWPCRSIIADL